MESKRNLDYYIESIYNVSIDSAIKYLNGLYCICDNTYTDQFKREKLLIIYQFCCMKNKVDIWENFGITFNSKSEIKMKDYHFIDLYGSILDRHPNQNTNSIIYDDLTDTSKIFPIYRISKYIKLSDKSKDLLTEIFRNFGGYNLKNLCFMLQEIEKEFLLYTSKENINNTSENLKIFLQNPENLKAIESNKIIEFINKYNFVREEEKTSLNFAKIFNEFRDKFLELSFEEQKVLLEKIDFIDSHEKIEPKKEKPFNLLRIRTKKRKNN